MQQLQKLPPHSKHIMPRDAWRPPEHSPWRPMISLNRPPFLATSIPVLSPTTNPRSSRDEPLNGRKGLQSGPLRQTFGNGVRRGNFTGRRGEVASTKEIGGWHMLQWEAAVEQTSYPPVCAATFHELLTIVSLICSKHLQSILTHVSERRDLIAPSPGSR
ncbi:hypothetical protein M427DRAFT_201412 [Gonapodya prolifera JEL478]|uniref:Uncharacterized protein n=1 Tax=Gonapodya prolifera (strain JEL478) TaxID=1344416 RepID=A0A138ZZP6_GONPJ|nr:hypothetical protein M427DRAFT_201412 [Gonapodya prolifera JEL478]|eukprot:KXS09971.1 hypothetical protein M427DRAFT_201412 [Gonapodya prolifera JEL478]